MTSGSSTRYRVRGGNPLQGTVFVQGAKNAALKMIAASLLAEKGQYGWEGIFRIHRDAEL